MQYITRSARIHFNVHEAEQQFFAFSPIALSGIMCYNMGNRNERKE